MWVAIVGIWLVFGVVGEALGAPKGHSHLGAALGLLLGPIGLVIVAVMGRTPEVQARYDREVARASGTTGTTRRCPWCAEEIQSAAIVCKHCGRDVVPA